MDRVLYIWPDGTSLAGVPAVGTGSLGQDGYIAFTVGNLGWWGCGYFVLPTSQMDLTDVTSDWVFHFAVRTDCAQDITVGLNGSTADPTDPFVTTKTEGKVILNKTNLPLSKRDKTQWVEFDIPMSQLMTNTVVSTNNLVYLAPLTDQNYLFFVGGNDTGSFIAWDNVYIGAPESQGVINPKTEKLQFSITGNNLNVFNNNSNEEVNIYSISGAHILSSKVNCIDISGLAAGVYVVKSGNQVNKFTKK
ncbi:T9SS type A sorting domain-containing protein [Porphyromonadaceae sp. NP-X]|nr:T9SS type A sorting domain-containing protein [Porphyromonadaceae sp. NP-X]